MIIFFGVLQFFIVCLLVLLVVFQNNSKDVISGFATSSSKNFSQIVKFTPIMKFTWIVIIFFIANTITLTSIYKRTAEVRILDNIVKKNSVYEGLKVQEQDE